MPYIPYTPVSPVNFAMGSVSGYTNGFFTIPTYNLELNAIAKELNSLQYQFTSLAALDPASANANWSSMASSSGLMIKQLGLTNELLKTLNGNVGVLANKMEVVGLGLATIASHASESVVTQQMAFADQQRNNKHQQLTTEAAQAQAGLKKTEVTPELTVATVQATIEEIGVIKAQASAASLVANGAASAFSYASTTALEWIAQSEIGKSLKSTYLDVKLYINGLFVKEKAVAVAIDAAADKNITMSGNATIPANVA